MTKGERLEKILGVTIGEKFFIKEFPNNPPYHFKENLEDLELVHDSGLLLLPQLVIKLFLGDLHIEKLPFRPKYDQLYFYIDSFNEVTSIYNNNTTGQLMSILLGNCYRTKGEAMLHIKEWTDKFAEVRNNVGIEGENNEM